MSNWSIKTKYSNSIRRNSQTKMRFFLESHEANDGKSTIVTFTSDCGHRCGLLTSAICILKCGWGQIDMDNMNNIAFAMSVSRLSSIEADINWQCKVSLHQFIISRRIYFMHIKHIAYKRYERLACDRQFYWQFLHAKHSNEVLNSVINIYFYFHL